MASKREPTRRTTLQKLTVFAGSAAVGLPSLTGAVGARPATDDDNPGETARYVAVVDRIVDGEHVVLLLEEDGQIVDELVVPRSAFDDVAESDILVVIVAGDDLVDYRILPERPCDDGGVDSTAGDEATGSNSNDGAVADGEVDCL